MKHTSDNRCRLTLFVLDSIEVMRDRMLSLRRLNEKVVLELQGIDEQLRHIEQSACCPCSKEEEEIYEQH